MTREDAATCLTCRFWVPPYGLSHPFVEYEEHGACHRHAPLVRVTSEHGHTTSYWPLMPAKGFCGDHELRQIDLIANPSEGV